MTIDKVNLIGRLGAGPDFKAVHNVKIVKVGVFDENRNKFTVKVNYEVDNNAIAYKKISNKEFYIYLDDYGERYAIEK